MSVIAFEQLPETARLWIYGVERELNADQKQSVSAEMARFLEEWTAHKRELTTGWQLAYDQFIMISVDESQMAASGCSIDSMVRNLLHLETQLGAQIVGTSGKVFYRDQSDKIRCVSRPEFKELASQGEVHGETIVFDNTVQTLDEFRRGGWEKPMQVSWHMEAFGKALV